MIAGKEFVGGDLRSFGGHHKEQMVEDLIEGLFWLLVLKVMHTDIKLGNMLIDQEGHCVIADFGAADRVAELPQTEEEAKKLARSVASHECFSPPRIDAVEYSAMHQANEELLEGKYDVAKEVLEYEANNKRFQIGCALYSLVTGSDPFDTVFCVVPAFRGGRYIEKESKVYDIIGVDSNYEIKQLTKYYKCSEKQANIIIRLIDSNHENRPKANDLIEFSPRLKKLVESNESLKKLVKEAP